MKRTIGILALAGIVGLFGMATTAHADTDVQASNSCDDCESSSGDATASNSQTSYAGQVAVGGDNYQDGDNEVDSEQDAQATSGDALSGQGVGVVGGSGDTNVVAANECDGCTATSGNAAAGNAAVTFVGLTAIMGSNTQFGDNEVSSDQVSWASSGDGVSGQIVGVVTA